MYHFSMSLRSPAKQHWIESPVWDGFWILNGLWLMPIALLLFQFDLSHAFAKYVTTNGRALFSSAHLLAPILSVYGIHEFRKVAGQEKMRYIWLPVLLFLIPISLIIADAMSGWMSHTLFPILTPVKLLAIIFITWNFWHFASHNFGVLSLYRVRASQFSSWEKKLDRAFTSITMLVLFPLTWYIVILQTPTRHLFDFLPTVATVTGWQKFSMITAAALTIAMLFIELRKKNKSKPKMLYYFVIGMQPLLAALSPLIFYALLINLNHWLSELALIGKAHANRTDSPKVKPMMRFFIYILLFVSIGLLLDHSFFRTGMAWFGTSLNFESEPFYLKDPDNYVAILLMGFAFGLHFMHMLCDRYLFAFRRPEVTSVINSLAHQKLR